MLSVILGLLDRHLLVRKIHLNKYIAMQTLPKDILLEFNTNTLESVRIEYNLDKPGRIDEAIDILDEWVKKQNHFTRKDFPREYLERIIISCKGLLERAKTRMDRLCTFKTLMPQFFENQNDKEKFTEIHNVVVHAHLPKMTPDDYRVYLLKVVGEIKESYIFTYYKYIIMLCEYFTKYDYPKGQVLVFDLREANLMRLVTALNVLELRQALTLLMDGHGMRLKMLHIISPSKAITTFVTIIRQVLSEKLSRRIHCHQAIDTLYEHVPRDIMPGEYGGKERSLKILNDDWIQMSSSEEYIKLLQEMNQARTIESYRQTDKFNEQYTGMPGSFRSLCVD